MQTRTFRTIYLILGTVFLLISLFNSLFLSLAILFFTITIMINSDINREELINFLSDSIEENVIQEEESIEENKPKGVSNMEAKIKGYREIELQVPVVDKETKEVKQGIQTVAEITLWSDVPDMLPVGKIVEVAVKKGK